MASRRLGVVLLATGVTLAAASPACSGGGGGTVDGNYDVHVSGQLIDWRSGAPIGEAIVRTVGISPARETEADDEGRFTLKGIPAFGYVIVDVTADGYARTLSPTILVEDEDLEDLPVEVLGEADATLFLGAFTVTPAAGEGHALGRVLTTAGTGVSGVAAIQLLPVTSGAEGPYFLDSADQPAAGATETSESGSFAFFNAEAGNVSLQGSAPGAVLAPAVSVVRDGAWSLVTLGGPPPAGSGATPTPVPTGTPGPQDFTADIVPIFTNRGCVDCHTGGQAPQGFRLDNLNFIHAEVTTELSPVTNTPRVNTADPDASLLLRRPTFEDPPDQHPNAIFQTPFDPDYQKIRRWISDGALP